MRKSLPHFFEDAHMVSAAMNILHMKGYIIHAGIEDSVDVYKASPDAMHMMSVEEENEKLNKEIDLEIKKRTRDNLKWQRWPMKYWYVVMILSSAISVAITKISEGPKQQGLTSLARQEIQALVDSSLNRRIPLRVPPSPLNDSLP